jgi:hypothetical protein
MTLPTAEGKMNRTIAVALALLCWGAAKPADAKKIHVILVADTMDGSIGPGVAENLNNMKLFFKLVESEIPIDVVTKEISGVGFNCKAINDAIAQLTIEPADAVVFYYSGHGFRRNATQTKFPEFDCRRSADPDTTELSSVISKIQVKMPRLILGIADTCNVEAPPPPTAAAAAAPGNAADRKAAFKRLFVDYSGTLMMSGAVPGEYSWYMTAGASLGGFFTNQLLKSINQKLGEEGPKIRWEDIASDATKPIFVPKDPPVYQTPQFAALNLIASKQQ